AHDRARAPIRLAVSCLGSGGHGAGGSLGRILPSPVRRDSTPDCEADPSPDIPGGRVVVLLSRTHHPAKEEIGLTPEATAAVPRPGHRRPGTPCPLRPATPRSAQEAP